MFWPLILTFIPNFALSTPQNLEKKLLILINRNIKDQRTFSLAYEFTFNPNSALSTPQSLEKKSLVFNNRNNTDQRKISVANEFTFS